MLALALAGCQSPKSSLPPWQVADGRLEPVALADAGVDATAPLASSPPLPDAASRADAAGPPEPRVGESSFALSAEYPIVFVSTRLTTGQLGLFLMTADGRDVLRVSLPQEAQNPVWSPDGRSIAFRRAPNSTQGLSQVALIAADGTQPVALTDLDQRQPSPDYTAFVDGPSWAPGGDELAYAAQDASGRWSVWGLSRAGGRRRRLMPELDRSHFHPSWAPRDPSRLAYVAETDGTTDVWLAHLDRPGSHENLTGGRLRRPERPRWSPDGTMLALSARDDAAEGDDQEVFVLELATGQIVRITANDVADLHPTWSPDGRQILFVSDIGCACPAGGCRAPSGCLNLWLAPLEEPARAFQLTSGNQNFYPDWYDGRAAR